MFAASKSGSAADPTDPQFNYVTMLLHGDGTNGAQNNTFVDSSTNNFTITRNGNTTQGTFTPYGSNWSNYFDGSSYLNAGTNAAFAVGTGDFTIEFWVFPTAFSGTYTGYFTTRTGGQGFDIQILNSSATLMLGNNSGAVISANNVLSLNTWQHVCAVRSGSTNSLYVNGTRVATGTDSTNFTDNGAKVCSSGPSGGNNGVGYISNLRLVKGTAVYNPSSSTITVPTTPLTAISGTSLLTTQSNRFIDNSTNAFAITVNGSPSVQRFSPFSPTTAYSTSVIGGSAYFDGSGDTLSLASQTALNFGTGDFTLEAWVYATTTLGDATCILTSVSTGGLMFGTNGAAGSGVWAIGRRGIAWDYSSSTVPALNQWQHVAVCRSGTSVRIFINGVQSGTTGTNSTAYDLSSGGTVSGYQVNYMNGYFSSIRATNTALYTTTFTPPSAPLTAVSGTALLLLTTNAGILDNAMMNDLETVGNAQISTSVKKFGTGSMYFDGTDDRLNMPSSPNLAFGTGDFTLEMWAYFTSTANFPTLTDSRSSTGSTSGFNLGLSSAKVQLYTTSQLLIGSSTLSANTWYHIAVTRASGTLKIWLNGTQDATVSNSTNWSDQTFVVGATPNAANFMTGYIDDLRITKGVARYTANFTAPTAAFADKG